MGQGHQHQHRERRPRRTPLTIDGPRTPALPRIMTFRYRGRLVVCQAGWNARGSLTSLHFRCPLCEAPHTIVAGAAAPLRIDRARATITVPDCIRCDGTVCRLHLHIDDGVASEVPYLWICGRGESA